MATPNPISTRVCFQSVHSPVWANACDYWIRAPGAVQRRLQDTVSLLIALVHRQRCKLTAFGILHNKHYLAFAWF